MSLRIRYAPLLISMLAAGTAHAQMDSREGIALQNQILELRSQLQQLQQSQGGYPPGGYQGPGGYQPAPVAPQMQGEAPSGGGAPLNSDTAAQLVVRVGNLEDQVRELQGKVDSLTNELQRQNDQFTKQVGDLQFKLGQGPAPSGAGAVGDTPPLQAPDGAAGVPPMARPAFPSPAAAPPRRTPENALHEANAALARRDYAAAAAAAREVLAGHGPRSADAQFLLARAESGQHQYREAAADFYQVYNHAPRSGTAPVALLGVANSLAAMNDSADACQALQKLSAEFPHAPGGLKTEIGAARKRAACH